MTDPLLVSAGEASADRLAAEILRSLGTTVHAFGMGGEGTKLAGMAQTVPMSALNVMGFSAAISKIPTAHRISQTLVREALDRDARVALLVGTSEFNQLLGKKLRCAGLRVLFCVPPQVWAWRASRLKSLRPSVDRLAVILPFEQPLWQSHGYDATYVGHPSLNTDVSISRENPSGRIVILPGSRDHEARSHAFVLADAAKLWCQASEGRHAHALISCSLSEPLRCEIRQTCRERDIEVRLVGVDGASCILNSYDAALSVSGTATLECALSGCPPVIVYRASWLTLRLAQAFLKTPWIGLPNIVLAESAFPELLSANLSPTKLVGHLDTLLLDRDRMLENCDRVRSVLVEALGPCKGKNLGFGARVAKLLDPLF